MIWNTRVDKVGCAKDYEQLPVIYENRVIGVVSKVEEYLDGLYLTITTWDRFLNFEVEFNCDSKKAFSLVLNNNKK